MSQSAEIFISFSGELALNMIEAFCAVALHSFSLSCLCISYCHLRINRMIVMVSSVIPYLAGKVKVKYCSILAVMEA